MENNTDNKKILKGGQKVVKTVWKMPQTRIKQGLPQILLRCHPYLTGILYNWWKRLKTLDFAVFFDYSETFKSGTK